MTATGGRPAAGRPARGAGGPAGGDARRREGSRGWVVGFTLRLLAGWAVAIVVLALAPAIERWAVAGTVGSVGAALRLASLRHEVTGDTVQVGGAVLSIIPECTPLMPALLLGIAMASYPASARRRLAGIAAGLAALWVFNVVRMLALLATLTWWPASFRFMHVYLWQTVTLLAVGGLFLAWLRWPEPRERRA